MTWGGLQDVGVTVWEGARVSSASAAFTGCGQVTRTLATSLCEVGLPHPFPRVTLSCLMSSHTACDKSVLYLSVLSSQVRGLTGLRSGISRAISSTAPQDSLCHASPVSAIILVFFQSAPIISSPYPLLPICPSNRRTLVMTWAHWTFQGHLLILMSAEQWTRPHLQLSPPPPVLQPGWAT
jgi:hypothetical protein